MNTAKDMTDNKACQATPAATLREQIMDCRIPKNEREHWAARHIEELEGRLRSRPVVEAGRCPECGWPGESNPEQRRATPQPVTPPADPICVGCGEPITGGLSKLYASVGSDPQGPYHKRCAIMKCRAKDAPWPNVKPITPPAPSDCKVEQRPVEMTPAEKALVDFVRCRGAEECKTDGAVGEWIEELSLLSSAAAAERKVEQRPLEMTPAVDALVEAALKFDRYRSPSYQIDLQTAARAVAAERAGNAGGEL